MEGRLRQGGPFLVLQVVRPAGTVASLLGTPPQLEVYPATVRLTGDGETLIITAASSSRAPREGERPEERRLPVASLLDATLGAPNWCARAAAYDMEKLARVLDAEEGSALLHGMRPAYSRAFLDEGLGRAGLGEDRLGGNGLSVNGLSHGEPGRAQGGDGAEGHGAEGYGVEGETVEGRPREGPPAAPPAPPTWHFVTLHPRESTPLFLCAPSEVQAIAWVAGLTSLLPREPPVTYAALLWRRVRLRLDARTEVRRATDVAAGSITRLGSLAAMLHSMAAEEEARVEWVRYHLAHGDKEGAARMGWAPHEAEHASVSPPSTSVPDARPS